MNSLLTAHVNKGQVSASGTRLAEITWITVLLLNNN